MRFTVILPLLRITVKNNRKSVSKLIIRSIPVQSDSAHNKIRIEKNQTIKF